MGDDAIEANNLEKGRLKKLEDHLQEGESRVHARGKQYDKLDMQMKDRELTVQKKDEQLTRERELLEDLKKNLRQQLGDKRAAFVRMYNDIGTSVQQWGASFDELYAEVPAPANDG